MTAFNECCVKGTWIRRQFSIRPNVLWELVCLKCCSILHEHTIDIDKLANKYGSEHLMHLLESGVLKERILQDFDEGDYE
jgi:hypothetical protein